MTVDFEYYRQQFYIEAKEIIENVSEDILRAEANPDDMELLNSIFRGIHTIKGSAGGFELNEISTFTHHLEGLLDALRNGVVKINPEIVDIVLNGVDHISKMIDDCKAGLSPHIDEDLVQRFKTASGKAADGIKQTKDTDAMSSDISKSIYASLPKDLVDTFKHYAQEGYHIFEVKVKYTNEEYSNGFDPIRLLKNLKTSSVYYKATCADCQIPPFAEFNPLHLYLHPTVYVATDLSKDDIIDLAFDISLLEVTEVVFEDKKLSSHTILIEDIDKDNLKEFMSDALESMQTIESHIINYEKQNDKNALNAIFRAVHTLKGDADYIGLKKFAIFTHNFENLLEALKNGTLNRSHEIVNTLLKAVDCMKNTIANIQLGKGYPLELDAIAKRLDDLTNTKSQQTNTELPDDVRVIFIEQVSQFKEILTINMHFESADDANARTLLRTLSDLKRISQGIGLMSLATLADKAIAVVQNVDSANVKKSLQDIFTFIDGLTSGAKRLGEILVQDGKVTEDDINEIVQRQKPVGELLIETGKVAAEDVQEALKKQSIMELASQLKPQVTLQKGDDEAKTMRVHEHKIDAFGNLIGEMVVARNTYEYLFSALSQNSGIDRQMLKAFKDNLYEMTRLAQRLQEGVMSLRMIPIKNVFSKFNRVVRDISRKQGKDIALITQGEDTEIDKKVADMLSDPLIHIVRNACDHGIEPIDERKRKNKVPQGTVILSASQEGSNLVIKVIDDGKGIDKARLYQKALSMGYTHYTSEDDPELLNFIFMAGVSTKEKVTDISGRGVGMDVVKTTVDALGGKVYVNSQPDAGCEVTLMLPTSMGIAPALLVEADKRMYAIPLDYVIETVKLSASEIKTLHDRLGIYHRGTVIACERLKSLLYNTERCRKLDTYIDEIPVVVLKSRAGRYGVIVDRFFKNLDIAIKPLPESLEGLDIISGVSIMGCLLYTSPSPRDQ
ncbi:MAG: Hpt domain-containing protein, partial [Thermodesulfovibrionales bacterium]|nr:Hpt domain-containing protein [Thermodesulfovibrionales bacterium]